MKFFDSPSLMIWLQQTESNEWSLAGNEIHKTSHDHHTIIHFSTLSLLVPTAAGIKPLILGL
jgi:hypothetical protein